jgi:hypothetical protein
MPDQGNTTQASSITLRATESPQLARSVSARVLNTPQVVRSFSAKVLNTPQVVRSASVRVLNSVRIAGTSLPGIGKAAVGSVATVLKDNVGHGHWHKPELEQHMEMRMAYEHSGANAAGSAICK